MSTDIKLDANFDITFTAEGDLALGDFFDTALLVSLFSEKRAVASEVPQPSRRRGWIGNEITPGFEIGSKLWLYEQTRLTADVVRAIESVVSESMAWMTEDGLLDSVVPKVTLSGNDVILNISFKINDTLIDTRYFKLWENTGK